MKPIIGWIVAVVLVSPVIIYALVNEGWWGVWGFLTLLLTLSVGFFVGSYLMLGAYRHFGWGEPAARSIFWWGWVGGGIFIVAVLTVLGPILGMRISNEPNLPTIAFWTAFGVWMGSVSRVNAIRKQLRTEELHP
jgi:hypothetical protein